MDLFADPPPRIGIIGAGFSGLCAAIQLKEQLNFNNFKIIERNADFGGVWWSNRYPGCACDVFSHLYSLSFEPNPDWTKGYAQQPEILEYIRKVAFKHELYENALFGYNVERVEWNENLRKWKTSVVNVTNGQKTVMHFDIIINGQGRFSIPKIPEQFSAFKNPIIHSAMWNEEIALEGKRVAVIGAGSTGAQLIPSIAPKVERLFVYMRHPPYIVPAAPVIYSQARKWCFKYVPFARWIYRTFLFLKNETKVQFFKFGSKLNLAAKAFCIHFIKQQIKDKKMQQQLIPDYEFGCKRVIPSVDFYETLNRDNVELITSPISLVSDSTLQTEDGKETQIDVLILATGFQIQDTYGSFQLIGCGGVNVHRTWVEDKPSAYLGIMTSLAPNYFILLGPNTAPGYTTVLFSLECQVNWMIQVIREILRSKRKVVKIRPTVEKTYMEEVQEKMQAKIYVHPSCGDSWFKSSKGTVAEIYPDTTFSYWRKTFILDRKDLEFL